MTAICGSPKPGLLARVSVDEQVLQEIACRVLWHSAATVDSANAGRPYDSGVKVGGHQGSSGSIVDIMVALWFSELTEHDRSR